MKALVPNHKMVLLNVKVTIAEKRQILLSAKKFANGNMSAWLRFASMNHKPARADLV